MSRSRLRMNEESSDDELGKIIKQRQKKLQKSKKVFIDQLMITIYFDQGIPDPPDHERVILIRQLLQVPVLCIFNH